ncbi:hypothetical protein D3C72_2191700 [compost metagenome]
MENLVIVTQCSCKDAGVIRVDRHQNTRVHKLANGMISVSLECLGEVVADWTNLERNLSIAHKIQNIQITDNLNSVTDAFGAQYLDTIFDPSSSLRKW